MEGRTSVGPQPKQKGAQMASMRLGSLLIVGIASVAAFSPSPHLGLAPSQMLRPRPVLQNVQLSWRSAAVEQQVTLGFSKATTVSCGMISWCATMALSRPRATMALAAAFVAAAVTAAVAWLRRRRTATTAVKEAPKEVNPVWDFAATLTMIAGDLAAEAASSAIAATSEPEPEPKPEPEPEPEPEPDSSLEQPNVDPLSEVVEAAESEVSALP